MKPGQAQQADRRLRELFVAEAAELVASLGQCLLAIEQDPGSAVPAVATLKRAVHTLKGSAAAAGFPAIEVRAHNWETCLKAIEAHERDWEPSLLDLLYRGLDDIEAEVCVLETGERPATAEPPPELEELRAAFGSELPWLDVGASLGTATARAELRPDRPSHLDGNLKVDAAKVARLMTRVDELLQLTEGEDAGALSRCADDGRELVRRITRAVRLGDSGARADLVRELEELRRVAVSALARVEDLEQRAQDHATRVASLCDRLRDDVRAIRMVPVSSAFEGIGRVVRDAARRTEKEAQLHVHGGATEADRELLDALKEPLLHLLRNAVAHGVETPRERVALGKARQGEVRVRAEARAGLLVLRISDDGRGFDLDALKAKAVACGLISGAEARALDPSAAHRLALLPGLSTMEEADELAGRGVGLDVVHDKVRALGGRLFIDSRSGLGSEFRLELPLHFTTSNMLLVTAGEARFAIPLRTIEQVMSIPASEFLRCTQAGAVEWSGSRLRLVQLSELLGLAQSELSARPVTILVVDVGEARVALAVDGVEEEHRGVVKSLGPHLAGVPELAGATTLRSGEIVPIVQVGALLSASESVQGRAASEAAARQRVRKARILIVDDSITTRSLERSILEGAGHIVEVADDGLMALALLRRQRFDLVLSDVEMQRLGGLELVAELRRDRTLARTPVILMSSLSDNAARTRGMAAGANAYLSKNEFEQDVLLRTVERFL